MDIVLYSTNKKNNSTLIPSDGTTVNTVVLKNGCSVLRPVLLLESIRNFFTNPCTEIKMQDKYYFVTGVRSVRQDLWEISCEIDVLASYKNEILSNTCFIEFDETENLVIPDTRLPLKAPVVRTGNIISMKSIMREGGTFLLGVTGKGSVNTFAFNQMDTIESILDSVNDWADAWYNGVDFEDSLGVIDALVRTGKQLITQGSAVDNIRSCIWIPWAINGVAVKDVVLGNYETGYTGYSVTRRTVSHTFTVKIPWQFNDWRNKSPYTSIYLYIPYVGFMHYSADELYGSTSLTITFSIDQITGSITAVVKSGEYIVGTYGGNSGITIPIGMSNVNAMQTVGSVVSSGFAALQNNWGGALSDGLGAVQTMLQPLNTTIGSFGNGSGASQPESIACYVYTHDIPDSPSSYSGTIGSPAYVVKKLSSLSGFVKTGNASVSVDGASYTERNMINALLNGGVFIE